MSLDTAAIVVLEILNSITILILLALGLALIFGMMRIVNLAQGEFFTAGAFTVLTAVRFAHLPLWVGMLLAPLVVAGIGIAIERLIIRRLYGRPLDVMLATWGVSLLLIGLITVIFGAVTQGIPFALGNFQVGRYSYPEYRIVMTTVAAGLMLGVYVLFRYTAFGRRARATIANPEMASAAGINTPRMFMLTFGLGAGLAGAAGAIMAPIVGVVPTMGVLYIARAFITVVVGGPVVLVGTLSSASALGFIEALISRFSLFQIETAGHCAPPPCAINIGGSAFFGQIALLIFAILLLRLLPQGISGFWRQRR
ncbi:MAG: branched-chain amino acid ABC transporter permease [Candidatus Rokuibacteriota bacterium]|nr:MAG: branched-chain amino acid ABC transporter permease [Candidatus Rokubacteria bacterium]